MVVCVRQEENQGMSHRLAAASAALLSCAIVGWAAPTSAEITVEHGEASGDWLNRIDLQVGGSIRPQYVNRMGSIDDGSYRHKDTRFRFQGLYKLTPHTDLKTYYELGMDIFHVLNIDSHYRGDQRRISTRQRFISVDNDSWGALSIGKQNSIYYDTIGVKTDVWDHDMLGQGPSNGINGDADDSYRGRHLVNYVKNLGKLDLYVSWILPSDTIQIPSDGPDYRRGHGGALAMNYHLTDDVEVSLAYSYNNADLDNNDSQG